MLKKKLLKVVNICIALDAEKCARGPRKFSIKAVITPKVGYARFTPKSFVVAYYYYAYFTETSLHVQNNGVTTRHHLASLV